VTHSERPGYTIIRGHTAIARDRFRIRNGIEEKPCQNEPTHGNKRQVESNNHSPFHFLSPPKKQIPEKVMQLLIP
jgi:hypothetical protein